MPFCLYSHRREEPVSPLPSPSPPPPPPSTHCISYIHTPALHRHLRLPRRHIQSLPRRLRQDARNRPLRIQQSELHDHHQSAISPPPQTQEAIPARRAATQYPTAARQRPASTSPARCPAGCPSSACRCRPRAVSGPGRMFLVVRQRACVCGGRGSRPMTSSGRESRAVLRHG